MGVSYNHSYTLNAYCNEKFLASNLNWEKILISVRFISYIFQTKT